MSMESSPDTSHMAETSLLDDYLEIVASGPEYAAEVAWQMWQALPTADRHALQRNASEMAYGNLAQSAAIARSLLLVEYVSRRALVVASKPL